MISIAVMGYGTVGSGVLQVIDESGAGIRRRLGDDLQVKYVLVRDSTKHPDSPIFIKEINVILQDPEIRVVVETIGGVDVAYRYVLAALKAGKSVCTSNKELVAKHGAELIRLARSRGVGFLFEASVCGGTALLAPLCQSMCGAGITGLSGIVNGTTNFMLTRMEQDAMSFSEALKMAQKLGYAETIDPSADVDGIDACRKTAILASLIGGSAISPDDIPTRGIRDITIEDIYFTKKMKLAVKLISWVRKTASGEISCGVEPMVLSSFNLLAGVHDVYNAVLIHSSMLGDTMFYGQGAGKQATACAVVSDVVECCRYGAAVQDGMSWEASVPKKKVLPDNDRHHYYIRMKCPGAQLLNAPPGSIVHSFEKDGKTALLTSFRTPEEITRELAQLNKKGFPVEVCFRMLEA